MATIKQYDPIIAILRSKLLANTELASFLGVWRDQGSGLSMPALHPEYLNTVKCPVFPAITICREYGQTLKNQTGYEENRYYIHGWIQDGCPDDIAYLYNLVVATLDPDPITGNKIPQFATCRKIDGKGPLYDDDTRTAYFMTEWLIYASKSLMYN